MKDYIKMRINKTNEPVRVYQIFPDGTAYCFIESEYTRQGSGGWRKMNVGKLRPEDVPMSKDYIGKTKKNKAKSRMKIMDAIWETTDGVLWKHEDIESAIAHEIELMNKEKEEKEENYE